MPGEGRPFEKGKSGNPAGRPKGTLNRTTLAMQALLDGEAEALTRKAIEMAQDGDAVALRMCLDRLLPVRKDRPVMFDLPTITTTADITKATAAVLTAVASGEITPSEAADIGRAVEAHAKTIEVRDLQDRIERLEARSQS
ncbi:hypothetical protein ASG52_24580 [Methylobacterium sp. Leaf456]|uniref:DUF5681 domain-containing protein n=1 Tax=Methylobacterium sp. Leaf456 TaxID=1736382 RepID=UPI0006FAFC43|nr:DUF5681 domain-containing protein [Methylobacterium sp. Leaf456]KQT56116.1 hypothetical protein ASG52_24580 [Methylobacterium sp. Leaf456]